MRNLQTALAFGIALASLVASGFGAVTVYPVSPGDAANPDYVSVKVNGVDVPAITTSMNVGYAHFAFTDTIKIEITAREAIKSFDLSPHRLKLPATASGNVLTFELSEPRKLHLRINDLSRFFLFAEAPELNPPAPGQRGVINLTDRGVSSSPDKTQTAGIQAAIDEAAAAKQLLYVPPGIYRSGRLEFKSGLRLYLAPGAIIKGTGEIDDYRRAGRGGGSSQQIYIGDASDVRIFGRGVIDGNGQELRRLGNNASSSKTKLIVTLRSRDLVVEGVILRQAGTWCVHMIESSDLRFDNVKVISMTRAEAPPGADEAGTFFGGNTDGFDPDNTSRVRVENSFISVDDDPIAVKLNSGARRDCDDIQFRGNVVWTMCSALKIGTEVADRTLSNVVFENNDVVHADVGIAVWCWRGGTVDGAKWINNHFEAIAKVKKDGPHAKRANLRLTIRDVEGKGHVRNLLIKDNTFENFGPNASVIQGFDADHIFDGVLIENLVIEGKRRASSEDARLTVGKYTKGVAIK